MLPNRGGWLGFFFVGGFCLLLSLGNVWDFKEKLLLFLSEMEIQEWAYFIKVAVVEFDSPCFLMNDYYHV